MKPEFPKMDNLLPIQEELISLFNLIEDGRVTANEAKARLKSLSDKIEEHRAYLLLYLND